MADHTMGRQWRETGHAIYYNPFYQRNWDKLGTETPGAWRIVPNGDLSEPETLPPSWSVICMGKP